MVFSTVNNNLVIGNIEGNVVLSKSDSTTVNDKGNGIEDLGDNLVFQDCSININSKVYISEVYQKPEKKIVLCKGSKIIIKDSKPKVSEWLKNNGITIEVSNPEFVIKMDDLAGESTEIQCMGDGANEILQTAQIGELL